MHDHPNQEVLPTMTDIVDLHLDQPLEHLRISPWHDPVVVAIGHDPRSTYVELFWLALLGPASGEGQNARRAQSHSGRALFPAPTIPGYP